MKKLECRNLIDRKRFKSWEQVWENKMCQWTSFKFSVIKLFSQGFGELTRCSQNMSCGQCEVSKRLVYRHILKSIVKKPEEKNQKFSFFGTLINFNQVFSSHAIFHTTQPWSYHLGLIPTCDFLGVNYCVNFSVHAIAKNGYITYYWTFQSMQ